MANNPVVHLELHTDNLPRACGFYTQLFGWAAETVHVGARSYLAMDLAEAIGGGVSESDDEPAEWVPYVEVPDVYAMTARAEELGAEILIPPHEGPAGWWSLVAPPAGARVALWTPKPGDG